jgi:hypothetical protein
MAGFTPVTYTRYERDESGQIVGSYSVTESVWTPDGVALLIASKQDERSRGPHGFPMSEATDKANQYAFEGSGVPSVDYAEKARLDAQAAYYKRYDTKDNPVNRNGHIWRVSKKPT